MSGYRIDCAVFNAAISGPAAAAVTERIAAAHLARSVVPADAALGLPGSPAG